MRFVHTFTIVKWQGCTDTKWKDLTQKFREIRVLSNFTHLVRNLTSIKMLEWMLHVYEVISLDK